MNEEVIEKILDTIKDSDGIKAREIARKINIEKTIVNSILYNQLNDVCWKDLYNKWHIVEDTGNYYSANKEYINSNIKIGEKYSRQEIHDIFEPETSYQPGCGAWGLRGIVRLKNSKNYIFFVTYGSEQAGHAFCEGISEQGVLTWQSQPSQDFSSFDVINFINHDERKNDIYLFKRNNKDEKEYEYLGKLKYLSHDPNRDKPVWFNWQIMNWNNSTNNSKPERDISKTIKSEIIKSSDLDEIIELYKKDSNRENLAKLFEATYKSLIDSGFSIEDLFNLL